MDLDFGQINWLAVVVAVIAAFIIGGLWYGLLFAKAWIRLHRYTETQVKAMSKGQAMAFGVIIVADLVAAVVLSLLVANLEIATPGGGLLLGFLVWLGFTAVESAKQNAAHRKPLAAFAIDASYALVTLTVMGTVIGGWR